MPPDPLGPVVNRHHLARLRLVIACLKTSNNHTQILNLILFIFLKLNLQNSRLRVQPYFLRARDSEIH